MQNKVTEIQIIPVKPKDGLVAFASFTFDNSFYFSSSWHLLPYRRAGTGRPIPPENH